jgi:hypothetical protein
VALVRELSAKLAESAAVAAMWQERARVLEERFALAAPQQLVEASTAPQSPEPATEASWTRWRTLAPWLLAVLAIVVAVGLLVGWPG